MLTEEQLHKRFPWTTELAFNMSMTKKDVDEKAGTPDGVVLLGHKTEKGVEKVHRFNTCAATPAPAACTTPVSGSLSRLVGRAPGGTTMERFSPSCSWRSSR